MRTTTRFNTEGVEDLERHTSIPYTGVSHVFPWIVGMEDHMHILASCGWQLYYVNFMFGPLGGSMPAKIRQMKRAIEKFYGRFSTEFVRNPRSPLQQRSMPQFWLLPDRPGGGRQKQSIREVKFNAGIHFNGPMAIPLISRFSGSVEDAIHANEGLFRRHGGSRIHIEPIKFGLLTLSDYQAKSIKWHKTSPDDILILPKGIGQLATKPPVMDAETRKFKAVQSSLNVSDEIAHNLLRTSTSKPAYA